MEQWDSSVVIVLCRIVGWLSGYRAIWNSGIAQ